MQIYRFEHRGSAHYGRGSSLPEAELLSGAPWAGGVPTGERLAVSQSQLLAPVAPSKIVCVGRNYAAHAQELGNQVPDEPLLFLKPPSALVGPGAAIAIPAASQRVEHEAEIGIVIGQRLAHVGAHDALRGIFGVTCVNDVTARDIQRKDIQFTRAKSFDTFCPVGPWIETSCDFATLSVVARVNGEQRQVGAVHQMIFGIGALLAFISNVMTLEPGDLVSTGTPHGVGPLQPSDVVEIEIPGVGVLRNSVVAAAPGR